MTSASAFWRDDIRPRKIPFIERACGGGCHLICGGRCHLILLMKKTAFSDENIIELEFTDSTFATYANSIQIPG